MTGDNHNWFNTFGLGMICGMINISLMFIVLSQDTIPHHGWKCSHWENTRVEPIEQECVQWSKMEEKP